MLLVKSISLCQVYRALRMYEDNHDPTGILQLSDLDKVNRGAHARLIIN